MAKYNRAARWAKIQAEVTSPVRTLPQSMPTFEGGAGYTRDPRSELFLLAVSSLVEDTFYESAKQSTERLRDLTHQVAVADPAWIAGLVPYLRTEANLRSVPLLIALEAASAMRAAGIPGSRAIVDSALARGDEPGEALAYWLNTYGRAIPQGVKKGIADAALRLYTEYSLLKYDTASHGVRFADVVDLTHPRGRKAGADALLRFALDRRHNRDDAVSKASEHLAMVKANADLRATLGEYPQAALDTEALKAAGMTWEDVLSLVGSTVDKRALWEALIPVMGYMALLRNLRNFDDAGISDALAQQVMGRLADPTQVARSRQLPLRFYSAYREVASLRWGPALELALNASLGNIPVLPGRTLVLVDRSGSMYWGNLSKRSRLSRADGAALFGAALTLSNVENTTLVQFGTASKQMNLRKGGSVLKAMASFEDMGGTYLWRAVREHFAGHDRVIIITDEQAHDSDDGTVPASVPLYVFNLVGYRPATSVAGVPNRHTFGGLTDGAFRLIPLLEAGEAQQWPWQQ